MKDTQKTARAKMYSVREDSDQYIVALSRKLFYGNQSAALREVIRYHAEHEGPRLGIALPEPQAAP